jgi:hypothetical protein
MEGTQTIIEAPQADDGHASNRSAGKKPQIFSFGQFMRPLCWDES